MAAGKIQNSIIPLNKFSSFEGLERNLLPPSQIQISPKLTDDATLIYRNNGVDAGKVVVSKLVLWIPRMEWCGGRKTSPRSSTIVQFIFYFGPLRSAIIF